ncbi:MAG: hypothetical protein RIR97_1115, partial [Pseudomonadota bacterium]
MGTSVLILIVLAIGALAFFAGRRKALTLASGKLSALHSLPGYHGTFVAVLAVLPALIVLSIWLPVSSSVIENTVRSHFPEEIRNATSSDRDLAYGMVRSISLGVAQLSNEEIAAIRSGSKDLRQAMNEKGVPLASDAAAPYLLDAAEALNKAAATSRMLMTITVIGLAIVGTGFGLSRITIPFRARNSVERIMLVGLILSSTIAILTTFGIVASMLSESIRFFSVVPPLDFFFGTVWDPRFAAAGDTSSGGQFGLIPLLLGTMYIAFVAMLFAVPIGLFSAIYMAEYASSSLRSTVKPLLEILAGIPTIVYGFFALVTLGPFLRDFSADLWGAVTGNTVPFIQAQSVLTAGLVMSIRLIPFVSSLSDDIITAVPRSLRDGSLGLGATRSETIKRVILPAALPGIVGAILLTASRAIGETMIVVMAAGVAANIQVSPFEPMTTVTVKIVNQLTGDLEFNSPQ